MSNPLAGIHNYSKPNWEPLKRAASIAAASNVEAPSIQEIMGSFMWMCEHPAGIHQYKHCDTRNYANLRIDSTPAECLAEIRKAFSMARTWGELLETEIAAMKARRTEGAR